MKTIDRSTWGSLRRLHTKFLVWAAANHEEPTAQSLLRWLYVEDFGPDRDGWSLMRIGHDTAGETASQPADPAAGG